MGGLHHPKPVVRGSDLGEHLQEDDEETKLIATVVCQANSPSRTWGPISCTHLGDRTPGYEDENIQRKADVDIAHKRHG